MIELELKALVDAPEALRSALRRLAGPPRFAGVMQDLRFDRADDLTRRGVVLRVRRYEQPDGTVSEVLAWKGPTTISEQGYKAREEIECQVGGPRSAADIIRALDFAIVHRMDRYVEIFDLAGATVRMEWYPQFDTLVEIEGNSEQIEAAIAQLPIAREAFTPDPLVRFEERFAARTGVPPRLALVEGDARPEHWP